MGRFNMLSRGTFTPPPNPLVAQFGALTRRGHGGWPSPLSGTTTISSDPSGLWTVDTQGNVVLSGTFGNAPPALAGPYIVGLTNGTDTVSITINIVANTYSVRSINSGANADTSSVFQLNSALNLATMGQTVQIRDGSFINPNHADWRTVPPANAGVSATFVGDLFTVNADFSVTDNFTPSQYIKVKCDTPLGAKIGRWMLSGNSRHAMGIHIEGVVFEWLYAGSYISAGIMTFGNNSLAWATHTKIEGCSFISNPNATAYGECALGVVGAVNTHQLWMEGCYGLGLHFAVNLNGTRTATDFLSIPTHCLFRSNYFERNFEDCFKLSAADDCHTLFNVSINFNVVTGTGAHPDHEQRTTASFNPGGTPGTYQFGSCIGNVYVRGLADPAEWDGQGMFMSTDISGFILTNGRVAGNLMIVALARGISVDRASGMIFEFNTIVRPSDSPITSNDQGIYLSEGSSATLGRYNVTFSTNVFNLEDGSTAPTTQVGNVGGIKDAQYAAAYVNPLFGANCNTPAKAIANFTGKAGGPLDPAVTGLPYWVGALNNSFIDRVARTYTPPV